MHQITTIGSDLAKSVFQVQGVDTDGAIVVKRKLRRAQVVTFFAGLEPCFVGMEACAGAHFWARELQALGHDVRIMPPSYVKRGKTDAADAEAICEAVTRPTMRFVPVKSAEVRRRTAALLDHKTRSPALSDGSRSRAHPRPSAHAAGEHDPGISVGVRHRRGKRHSQ
jgi:transposase